MAKLAQAIDTFSDALGIPRPTVEVFTRPLRDQRMISTGGRGKNAPDMKARDLAVILLSLITGGQANQAAARVFDYSEFALTTIVNPDGDSAWYGDENWTVAINKSAAAPVIRLKEGSPFIDAVEEVLALYSLRMDHELMDEKLGYIAQKYKTNNMGEILRLLGKEIQEGLIEDDPSLPSFKIAATEGPNEHGEIVVEIWNNKEEDDLHSFYFLAKDHNGVFCHTNERGGIRLKPKIGMNIRREVSHAELYMISRMLR